VRMSRLARKSVSVSVDWASQLHLPKHCRSFLIGNVSQLSRHVLGFTDYTYVYCSKNGQGGVLRSFHLRAGHHG
jgi:hypothetical protein